MDRAGVGDIIIKLPPALNVVTFNLLIDAINRWEDGGGFAYELALEVFDIIKPHADEHRKDPHGAARESR